MSITHLIERFHDTLPALKRGAYNETEVRVQFINPLFEALGWDVDNRAGRGIGVHWPELDEDIAVEDLVLGRPSGEGQASLRRWLAAREQMTSFVLLALFHNIVYTNGS